MNKYLLSSKRVGLRLLSSEDIEYLCELNSDPEVRKFFPDGMQNRQQTETRMNTMITAYEEAGFPCFILFHLESEEFMGRAGFGQFASGEIEVGYLLHKKFWHQGYATEILTLLLGWAKNNINKDYIIAMAPKAHLASLRVMQKCGMQYYKEDMAYGVPCDFFRINNRV